MSERAERWLLAVVPFVAMLSVALGLRLGAPSTVRAALVYAAAPAGEAGLAWQIVALEDQNGARSAIAALELAVTARSAGTEALWRGATNEDGVAEAALKLPVRADASVELEVRTGQALLARGVAQVAVPAVAPEPTPAWMPFAQRSGPIALDVAVRGQRAAPGFAASLWVRATERTKTTRGGRIGDATVAVERDPSIVSAISRMPTDAAGWAEIEVVPVGLAVTLRVHASTPDGRSGDWTGGLFMSPGAARLETRGRWAPDETPQIDVTFPGARITAYVEIDDLRGRAWATALSAPGEAGATPWPSAHAVGPTLVPGLYWAVASNDPSGAAVLGSGTSVRPFFVAASDEAALAFGSDPGECAAAPDPREASRRLATCLAVTAVAPVSRWLALDGFASARARDKGKRASGLAVALGALFTAMLLEGLLVLRAAAAARARLRKAAIEIASDDASPLPRAFGVAIGLLVALLGLILLAAFLVRAA